MEDRYAGFTLPSMCGKMMTLNHQGEIPESMKKM
jgi:hypothetical protein